MGTMRELRELPLVADGRGLAEVSAAVGRSDLVALDTEFVRERTYYPELCLVQVATDDLVACIDMLAPIDFESFYTALHRDDCTWVLHSARQDLEVIGNSSGRAPVRLIDTQIAGALIGLPTQLGLQPMLATLLGVELAKTETRTDWSRRPLAERAIRYAIDDVRYLLPAWHVLRQRLERLDRLDWLEEDCRRVLAAPPPSDAPSIFERMRGTGGLDGPDQAAALALIAWREEKARALNRPRRWILGDEQVVRIARALSRDIGSLERVPDLPRKLVARWGAEIAAAIGAAAAADGGAEPKAPPASRIDKSVLKTLQADVRRRAAKLGIEPEVLATRRELVQLAAGEPPAALAHGWRAEQMRSPGP